MLIESLENLCFSNMQLQLAGTKDIRVDRGVQRVSVVPDPEIFLGARIFVNVARNVNNKFGLGFLCILLTNA